MEKEGTTPTQPPRGEGVGWEVAPLSQVREWKEIGGGVSSIRTFQSNQAMAQPLQVGKAKVDTKLLHPRKRAFEM